MTVTIYTGETDRERLAHSDSLPWEQVWPNESQFGDGDEILFAVPIVSEQSGYVFEYHVVRIECESIYHTQYLCNGDVWQWHPSDAAWFVRLN